MKHQTITQAMPAPTLSTVSVLQFNEHLRLDPEPLAEIFASQGEDAAEDIICRTLTDLSYRLSDVQQLQRQNRFDDMVMPARRIAAIAGQIGLVELSCASDNVANAAGQGSGIAVEATLSRVERCFELAMSEVWNFRS